ncbi:hypothetical protein Malapachy_1951 [Malassezia pachydermatis]|uniref:Nuclear matrix protein n=1 Tax=Malassezia pachydermatis TaxID=77020 RepID=A0A0M9VNW2_9BASI|nr:hypothetical protein Malapachy_1951 [Malassezia pachydermatis]KOS13785.1 hypothetical protein Malapachy_1951 [Malassezia pachydermatis]
MSARRDTIAQWTSALEGQLPAWHAALQTAKQASTSTSWDPAAVSACMQATLPSLLPLYEQASDMCKAARTEADKPCVWDDVLFTSTWELIHAYILSAGHVNDVMDRVDMALVLADAGCVDASLPLSSLEDWMEQAPLSACMAMVSYLEIRASWLTENMVPTSGKGLVYLRLCNELLRRLSRAHTRHAAVAGRILSLLASTFAVHERSGVNLKGDFDTARSTQIDEVVAEAPSLSKPTLDEVLAHPQFYRLFWSLQSYFANPALLFGEEAIDIPGRDAAIALGLETEATCMSTFQGSIGCVLNVFQHLNKEAGRAKPRVAAAAAAAAAADEQEMVYPKYLGAHELFAYQLHDVAFRRQFVIQCLMLFQYLLGQSQASRERAKDWKNQLLVLPYELKEKDETWARKTWRQAQSVLRQSGADSDVYLDTILPILRRESSWIQWKGAGAPSIEKRPLEAEVEQAWVKRVPASRECSTSAYPHALGTAELSAIWADGFHVVPPRQIEVQDEEGHMHIRTMDGWEDLEFPQVPPSVVSMQRQLQQTDDDDHRQSIAWRALRCVGREHMHLVAHMTTLDDLPSLLAVMEAERKGAAYDVPTIGAEPPMDEDEGMAGPPADPSVEDSMSDVPRSEAASDAGDDNDSANDNERTTPTQPAHTLAPAPAPGRERASSSDLSSSDSSPLSPSSQEADADATFMTARAQEPESES